jgi:hypothetical protein
MADFEPGTEVVVKATPTLLGVGKVIPTPSFSNPRFTWAKFAQGTECAFEPGELAAAVQPMSTRGMTAHDRLSWNEYQVEVASRVAGEPVKFSGQGISSVPAIDKLVEAINSLPTLEEIASAKLYLEHHEEVPTDFEYHPLSKCADQSTCPIHPAPTSQVLSWDELMELERKYPEPTDEGPKFEAPSDDDEVG